MYEGLKTPSGMSNNIEGSSCLVKYGNTAAIFRRKSVAIHIFIYIPNTYIRYIGPKTKEGGKVDK